MKVLNPHGAGRIAGGGSMVSASGFGPDGAPVAPASPQERQIFIDNLLVRIHSIIKTTLVDRPCDIKV